MDKYTTELYKSSTALNNELRNLVFEANETASANYEKYLEKVRASSSSDDPREQTSVAWMEFVKQHSELVNEYQKKYQAHYQSFQTILHKLNMEASHEAINNMISYLQYLKDFPSSPPAKSATQGGKTGVGKK